MFRVRRRCVTRLSAVLVASCLLAAGATAAAAPAPAGEQNPGGATAVLADGGSLTEDAGPAVIHDYKETGEDRTVPAGLFRMDVDGGGSLMTYSVDVFSPTDAKARYRETPWERSSLQGNEKAGEILWILRNSYPQVNDLDKLAGAADVESLDPRQAAAGTQVAIWRLSDHVDVEAADPNAQGLVDYLLEKAQPLREPKASLALGPAAVSGRAGDRLGPVTLRTSASSALVEVDPVAAADGIGVVDRQGRPVTFAADGDELFFDVPADADEGSASLIVRATTPLAVGRAFTSVNGVRSQTQILAGTSASAVEAAATATWASADHTGPLPAVTAERNCAESGLDITVTNKGGEEFVFSLGNREHRVAAGSTETAFRPVGEDGAYKVEIPMPDGTEKVFEGVLDCATDSAVGHDSLSGPRPASAGGSSGGLTHGSADVLPRNNLAETGSSSATPVIIVVAVALVAVGGAAVLLLHRRRSGTSGE